MAERPRAASDTERRSVIRVPVRRSVIKLADSGRELPLREVSPQGLSFYHLQRRFSPGEEYRIDLLVEDQALVSGLTARVVWRDAHVAGCVLTGLDTPRQRVLSEFVLQAMNAQLGDLLRLQRAADEPPTLH